MVITTSPLVMGHRGGRSHRGALRDLRCPRDTVRHIAARDRCQPQLQAAELIPEVSDHTEIPGNRELSNAACADRIERWFHPYHDAVEKVLAERGARGVQSIVISIHSMTAALDGNARPWMMALSSHLDRRLTDPMLAALRLPGDILVSDNQPYDIDPLADYSIPFHAIRRGLLHLQVEFRQDLVESAAEQRQWAARFAKALAECTGERDAASRVSKV